jgi:predicted secreted protein
MNARYVSRMSITKARPGKLRQRAAALLIKSQLQLGLTRLVRSLRLYTGKRRISGRAHLVKELSCCRNPCIAQARKVKGISVTSGNRHSYPIYAEPTSERKGPQITAWRERAELRLESADFSALSTLTGELLQTLSMGDMSFSIAPSTRKSHEDTLLKDAVAAFKARADLATQALGGSDYKLVRLDLNGGGFQHPAPMRMEAMKGAAMMDAAVTPEIEAGTSQVSINADGVIEVLMP